MVRLKHRWIVAQILNEQLGASELSSQEIQVVLREKIQTLYGDVGAGSFGNMTIVRFFNKETNIFVVRSTRDAYKDVWFAMSCISAIQRMNVVIRVIRVSGSVRTCVNFLQDIFESVISKAISLSAPDELESKRLLFNSQIQLLD